MRKSIDAHDRKAEKGMKTVDILGANRFENYTKIRDGSRAIIIQNGKILLTHETNSGWWLIPGGGIEEGETSEEYTCLISRDEWNNEDIIGVII